MAAGLMLWHMPSLSGWLLRVDGQLWALPVDGPPRRYDRWDDGYVPPESQAEPPEVALAVLEVLVYRRARAEDLRTLMVALSDSMEAERIEMAGLVAAGFTPLPMRGPVRQEVRA